VADKDIREADGLEEYLNKRPEIEEEFNSNRR
jgi:hypothetical protein